MLERTKTRPTETDQVFIGVICKQAIVNEVTELLREKGCIIQPNAEVPGDKEWYSNEEVFPGFHAGNALRGARYRENISQRQLAKLTGVSVQNISAMENGRRPIGKEMAKRFAEVLNTDWRLLLS